MTFRELNNKPVSDGQTCSVDHTVAEFKVVVRSINSVGPNDLKNLIEQKFEVVAVEEVNTDHYGHVGRPDF